MMMTSVDGLQMAGNYGEAFAVWVESTARTVNSLSTNCVAYGMQSIETSYLMYNVPFGMYRVCETSLDIAPFLN
jgi:hypothetical protein